MRQSVKAVWMVVVAVMVALTMPAAYAAVGRTPGSFSVSPGGAATYSIPIWLPPGPNGAQPSLALTYDSQGGNGIVGVGWSVSGASMSIERCEGSRAQDIGPRAVTLTATDYFCINGNRLRSVGGVYGAANSTYQTELADFSRITAMNLAGTGPESFKVEAKNGLIYEYGNTANSRVMVGTVTSVLRWMLNKVSDRNGNNYIVTYNTATGVAVPATISWTPVSLGATTYQYKVVFNYSTNRTDKDSILGSVAGQSIANRNRLDNLKIQSVIGGVTTTKRHYKLTYDTGPVTSLSRLTQIQECTDDAATNCLSPTNVVYQAGQSGTNTSASTATASATMLKGKYDLNGDGKSDLAYVSGSTWNVLFATNAGFSAVYNTGISSTAVLLYGHLSNAAGDSLLSSTSGGTWLSTIWNSATSTLISTTTNISFDSPSSNALTDIDGDGFDDLVTFRGASIAIYTRLNLGGNSTVGFSSTATLAFQATTTAASIGGCGVPVLSTGSTPTFAGSRYLDFNGDGKRDLLMTDVTLAMPHGNAECRYRSVLLVSGTSGFYVARTYFSGVDASTLGTGELNSDRCTDLINNLPPPGYISFSTCDGLTDAAVALPTTPPRIALLDWDGDGRKDLLVNNSGTVGVYLMTGAGVGPLISTTIPITGFFVVDKDGDGRDDIAVVNGTVVSFYMHGTLGATVSLTQMPDLMASVTDGYGVSAAVTYVSTAQSSYYTKGTGTVAPLSDFEGPKDVVGSVTLTDGVNGTYVKSYQYVGARYIRARNDLDVGFGQITETDSRTGLVTKTTYEQAYPYSGMVGRRDVLQSNGTLVSRSDPSFSLATLVTTLHNESYFPYVSSVTSTTYEFGGAKNGMPITSSVTTYTYSPTDVTYGNLTSVATTTSDVDATAPVSPYVNKIWSSTRTYSFDYTNAISNWCLGIPTQITVSNTAPAVNGLLASSVPRTTTHPVASIDFAKCRVKKSIVAPSTSYQVTQDLAFDAFGNVSSDTVTGANVPAGTTLAPRVTTVDWGTTGQFPVTIRDPASIALALSGYKVVRGYDYGLGVQTSEVTQSLDGSTNNAPATQWHFDEFGRIDTVTRPDGTSTAISYNNCTNVGGCQNGDPASGVTGINKMVVIATQKDSAGASNRDDWAYLDQFDRTIVRKSKTLTGAYSRVGTQYDALGRIAQRTEPCNASGCTPYWTVNHYDALNRLTDQKRPNWTQVATMDYQGRTTLYTDPQGKVTTRVSTVLGQLGWSKDHNGYRQEFAYDAFGSLVLVQDNSSTVINLLQATYVYGTDAFLTDVTDIDLDISTTTGQHRHYNYDALGEIVSYSDARGSTTTFLPYDPLGRPTQRTEATSAGTDLSTTWNWGSNASAHNIGRLSSVSANGPQSYSESYLYDDKGRVANRTIQGNSFDLSYNAFGELDTLTYPVSTSSYRLALKYGYSLLNGSLQTIKDANNLSTVFWTAIAQNARGQITQETLGNNVVINRAIDAVTGWTSAITAGAGGGAALQNQSYLYDLLGNVTQRQDGNAGQTESICYDNLYRLDHTTSTGLCISPAKLRMTYDAMGNIDKRSDVAGEAQWTRSTVHIHQVLQAGDTAHTYTYDNNGNAITRNGSSITWTSYNRPLTINAPGESSTFSYGQDHQKWMQQYSGPIGTETTTYLSGLLEKVVAGGVTDWRHYIFAGNEQVAVYSRLSAGTNTLRYTLEDNLGSPSAILPSTANPTSALVKESFEPYGARRNPSTWIGPPVAGDLSLINGVTRVGYTGQTMLGNMGLIHMNGRVLDPVTGRFLSADPYVVRPGSTQNFNRYGYVRNNPLTYRDPSGFADCSTRCNNSVPWWVTDNPSATIFFANGLTWHGGLGLFGVDAWPNVQTKTNLPDQLHIGFFLAGTNYMVGDFNTSSGKFTWFDGWEGTAAFSGSIFGRYASFGAQVSGAANGVVRDWNRGVVAAGFVGSIALTGAEIAAVRAAERAFAAGNGSGITVLGQYPGYLQTAEQLGANVFSVSEETWAQMSVAEQWAANQAFLDAAIARGDSFVFSHSFAEAGSFFERELMYLMQQRVFLGFPP